MRGTRLSLLEEHGRLRLPGVLHQLFGSLPDLAILFLPAPGPKLMAALLERRELAIHLAVRAPLPHTPLPFASDL